MASHSEMKLEFRKLYKRALEEEESRIVPLWAEMVKLGLGLNMVYKRKALPTKVGVHRRNRDGAIVSGRESMGIWDDIDKIGVSPDLYKDATAFEEPSSRINEIEFLKLCKSDESLRNYSSGEIEISAVACSHWNQALAGAMAQLAPCMHAVNILILVLALVLVFVFVLVLVLVSVLV
jgi:hypothetical protein